MPVDAELREPSDADLITAVAAGDDDAYGLLWQRHESAARRFAAQLTRPANVDDLVSEGFLRVLRAIKGGGGPESAFRPYLFNTIRRYHIDTGRSYAQRVALTDDTTELDIWPAESAGEEYAVQVEQRAAWQAWESLPDESRALLWHLIVEEETPAQVAPLLGVSANGVASRAVRARERLRQAFLVQHLAGADNDECRQTRAKLGAYVRNALATRDRRAVEAHLQECNRCAAALAELADVNHTMRVLVAPLLLGGGLIAERYLAGAHHAGAAGASGARGLRAAASRTTGKIAVAAGVAACAAGAIAYALTAGGSPHSSEPRALASVPSIASTVPAAPVATPTSPGPATPAPGGTAPPPARGTTQPRGTLTPALPPSRNPPAANPPAPQDITVSAAARLTTAPPSATPSAGPTAKGAPAATSATTPPASRPPATSTPPATPTNATVSIPLPAGSAASVTASAPTGWTITGWHTDTPDASGGPTDARHATWQIAGGSALVVTATGPSMPSALLVVHVTPTGGTAQTSAYPLT